MGSKIHFCRKCARKLGMKKPKKVRFDWKYHSMDINGVEYIRRDDVDKLLSRFNLKYLGKKVISEKKSTWTRRK